MNHWPEPVGRSSRFGRTKTVGPASSGCIRTRSAVDRCTRSDIGPISAAVSRGPESSSRAPAEKQVTTEQAVDECEPEPLRGKRLCSRLPQVTVVELCPAPHATSPVSLKTLAKRSRSSFVVDMKEEATIVLVELNGADEFLASFPKQSYRLHENPPSSGSDPKG